MAYEITITITNGTGSTRSIHHTPPRKVIALALPSLPRSPTTSSGAPAFLPSCRLEVVDAAGKVLYRRPYARPGYAEAYGLDSAWTRLPAGHPQVLVTLVPAFADVPRFHVKAYELNNLTPWLDISVP